MNVERKELLVLVKEINNLSEEVIPNATKKSSEYLSKRVLLLATGLENELTDDALSTLMVLRGEDCAEGNEGAEGAEGAEGVLKESDKEDYTSRKYLNLAAQDMNEIMCLDPGIDIELDEKRFMKAFKKAAEMASGKDNFHEDTWATLEALGIGPKRILPKAARVEQEKKEKPATKAAQQVEKSATNNKVVEKTTKKAAKSTKASKEPAGPPVRQSIIAILKKQGKKPFTRDEIHTQLVSICPHRNPDSLMSSIKTQIPGKLTSERGFEFEVNKQTGTIRVLTFPK